MLSLGLRKPTTLWYPLRAQHLANVDLVSPGSPTDCASDPASDSSGTSLPWTGPFFAFALCIIIQVSGLSHLCIVDSYTYLRFGAIHLYDCNSCGNPTLVGWIAAGA